MTSTTQVWYDVYIEQSIQEPPCHKMMNKFYLILEKREVVLVTEEDAKAWMECDEAVIIQLGISTLQLSRWNNSGSKWELIG